MSKILILSTMNDLSTTKVLKLEKDFVYRIEIWLERK